MGILRADRVSGLGGANAIKGSVSFNNNQGDYLNGFLKVHLDSSNRSNFLFDGDFTIECWVFKSKSTVSGDYDGLLYISTDWRFKWQASNYIMYYDNGTDAQFMNYNTNEGFLDNNWHHLAIVRSSNTITGYVDGTSYGTASESGNFNPGSNTELLIGYNVEGFGGFISNLRIVKGTAVYTGNFTPPTSELTAIDGTVLLCCQSPGNVLQEATGNYVVESVVHPNATLNSKPPSSSHFTPNSPVGFSTTSDIGTQFGTTFDGVTTFDSQAYMVPPGGNTRERNRGRGVLGGGYVHPSVGHNSMMYIEIQSQGNAQDFGDLTVARSYFVAGQTSSSTRGLNSGGFASPGSVNTIDFITIANTANATDFGDTINVRPSGGLSNQTRSVHAGTTSPFSNVIDFVTIATTGDAQNFGDLVEPQSLFAGASSSTRGVFGGGRNNTPSENTLHNTMQFITIATTGDAQDFGDLQALRYGHTGFSSPTRGIFAGGYLTPGQTASIDFFTIATLGNSEDFGDLSIGVGYNGSVTNSTRGVITINDAPNYTNALEFITIATTGNAKDFGDADPSGSAAGKGMGDYPSGISDSHGGVA